QEALAALSPHMILTTSGNDGPSGGVISSTSLTAAVPPTAAEPQNAVANAKLAGDAALRKVVTSRVSRVTSDGAASGTAPGSRPSAAANSRPAARDAKVTSADVLEALHRATGRPIIADYYTRLYPASEVEVVETPLFDALNRLADRM